MNFSISPVGRPSIRSNARWSANFAATGLPIIVAVTSVSVDAGQMSTETASLLVGAGATTVLVLPMLAMVLLGSTQGRDRASPGVDTPTD